MGHYFLWHFNNPFPNPFLLNYFSPHKHISTIPKALTSVLPKAQDLGKIWICNISIPNIRQAFNGNLPNLLFVSLMEKTSPCSLFHISDFMSEHMAETQIRMPSHFLQASCLGD